MLRMEGEGGKVLYEMPFRRILGTTVHHSHMFASQGDSPIALAYFSKGENVTEDQITRSLAQVESISSEAHWILRRLPKHIAEHLVLPTTSTWWRVLFHLAWHFPRPFLKATRWRLLMIEESGWGKFDETVVELNGTSAGPDVLPGLIYSELEHDLCTCSEAAIAAVLEALECEATEQAVFQHGFPLEVVNVFRDLREQFLLPARLPLLTVDCKLMKLADSFASPPATEWADLKIGGCIERFVTLSRFDDQHEIVQIRGAATDWVCELAERAGAALPASIPDQPIMFDNFRRDQLGSLIGMSGPRPVMNRDPLARWLGFVFAMLKDHNHEALQVKWGTDQGPLSYGLATLDRDVCTASALAIELAGLTREAESPLLKYPEDLGLATTGPRSVEPLQDSGRRGNRRSVVKPAKRSWTQQHLDEAILKYRAERASTYNDLREGVRKGRPGAVRSARKMFGRNAIADALGVKARAMVSKSLAWGQIADELGLRGGRTKTGTAGRRRIGMDIASEEQAVESRDGPLEQLVRRETIAMIETSMSPKAAEATIEKLRRGELEDDRARELAEACADQQKDARSRKVRQGL
jgi:hypothetical protein